MTRRDPFTEIEDLLERMGREFEELGGTLDSPGGPPSLPGGRDLAVDVIEDDEAITVVADLPGFDEDDIDVEIHDDTLSIAATREEETEVSVGDEGDEASTRASTEPRPARRTSDTTVASVALARSLDASRSPHPSRSTVPAPRTTAACSRSLSRSDRKRARAVTAST